MAAGTHAAVNYANSVGGPGRTTHVLSGWPWFSVAIEHARRAGIFAHVGDPVSCEQNGRHLDARAGGYGSRGQRRDIDADHFRFAVTDRSAIFPGVLRGHAIGDDALAVVRPFGAPTEVAVFRDSL